MKRSIESIWLIVCLFFLSGCIQHELPATVLTERSLSSVESPSGQYLLHNLIDNNEKQLSFYISNVITKETIFTANDYFDYRHTTYIMWGDTLDEVWIYSGDVGTFVWRLDTLGRWEKQPLNKSIDMVPKYILNTKGELLNLK